MAMSIKYVSLNVYAVCNDDRFNVIFFSFFLNAPMNKFNERENFELLFLRYFQT